MGCPLKDTRAVMETCWPFAKTRPGNMESAGDRWIWVPMAVLVSRLAASGGPWLPGSRANTNKGASDTSRDFKAGAMLILTVTPAPLIPPADVLVPAGDALVPAGAAPAVAPATEPPAAGPSS